jgi:hypothetical protein
MSSLSNTVTPIIISAATIPRLQTEMNSNQTFMPSTIIQTIMLTNTQNVQYEALLNSMTTLKNYIQANGYQTSLDDIIKGYHVYAYRQHKFSVPSFNYYQRIIPTSQLSFGNNLIFPLNNTDQFIGDIVLNIKIAAIGDPTLTGPAISRQNAPQYHYCDFPGVRLTKLSTFEIDDIKYESYEPKTTMIYRQFDLPLDYQQAWDVCHGQEQPIDGYVYMPDSQCKVKQQILNGPQTPKTYQPVLDLWIKGNFFFNHENNPLPVGGIYTKSRNITYNLENISNILFVRLNGQSYGYGTQEAISAAAALGITLPPIPNIISASLYVNNISMDSDIYKLYIQQVGYCVYRLHNSYKIQLVNSSGIQLLDKLRFATESIRFGLQPLQNQQMIDSWYKFTGATQNTIPIPIYLSDPNGSAPNISIANVRYRIPTQVIDTCGFYIKGEDNKLYDLTSPTFYSSYLQTRLGMLYAPSDPGLMAITFNRPKNDEYLETNGYFDLTQMRELYFNWTSSYINMNNPVELFISTKSINILEIDVTGNRGYRLKFFM